jgi:hypothetical protein
MKNNPARFLALLAALSLAAALSARAAPGGVVITTGSTYYPGDDCVRPGGPCIPAPPLVLERGTQLTYVNLETSTFAHTVTSFTKRVIRFPGGRRISRPLFDSGAIGIGKSGDVRGISSLKPGTYHFYCTIHPLMQGTLTIA